MARETKRITIALSDCSPFQQIYIIIVRDYCSLIETPLPMACYYSTAFGTRMYDCPFALDAPVGGCDWLCPWHCQMQLWQEPH
jgi:hypothetical protein